MGVKALADAGALLAYLDRRDPWHARCRAALTQLDLPLLTSTAVLAELFHLVGDGAREVDAAWALARSALRIAPVTHDDLGSLETLMRRYRDRPMDFADATLVRIAERESIFTVFTVDNDDFETYRASGRRRFRILPGRSARP